MSVKVQPAEPGRRERRDDACASGPLTPPAVAIDPEDAETEVAPRRAGPAAAGHAQITGEFDAHLRRDANLDDDRGPLQAPRSALRDSVQISGEEAEQARRLTEMIRDGDPTVEIDPNALPRLTHECRMCGEKLVAPTHRRFGMPPLAGFRCERCGNTYCAAHVVRVSGLFETLLRGARFSCQLCLPQSQRPR